MPLRPAFRLISSNSPLRYLLGVLMLSQAHAATITVTTLADAIPPLTNGQCSLREALANASNDASTFPDCPAGTGDDEITFATSLFPALPPRVATIQLAGELIAGQSSGTPHALAVRAPVDGAFATRVRLKASTVSPHRVMTANTTARPFSLTRFTIEGGRATSNGGGLFLPTEEAHLLGVSFFDNQADTYGGGIAKASQGLLLLNTVHFENNVARFGGALGIWNARTTEVQIVNSSFANNQVALSGNTGGAINFELQAFFSVGEWLPSLEINGTSFVDNRTDGQGGGIYFRVGQGSNQRFRVLVTDSLFRGNIASGGGGLGVQGTQLGTASVAGNSGGDVVLRRNSFIENIALRGGGAAILNANLVLENNLFSGNTTHHRGGGLSYVTASVSLPRSVALIGNTFHDQRYLNPLANPAGRTLWVETEFQTDIAHWRMAGNLVAPTAGPPPEGQECRHASGSFASLPLSGGDNLAPVADCLPLGASDILANPMVSASASGNALRPISVLPQAGSPAIDAWPAEACLNAGGQPLNDDLRGAPRPTDGNGSGIADCDIGAFELPAAVANAIFASGFEN